MKPKLKMEKKISHRVIDDEPIEPVYPLESLVGPSVLARPAKLMHALSKADKVKRAAAQFAGWMAGPDLADAAPDKEKKFAKGGAVRGHGCEKRGKTKGKFR